MTENELNLNEMEEVVGGAGKDGPGGSAKPLPPKAGCIVYQIKHGDNLTRIANTYRIPVEMIVAVNRGLIINPSFIRAGFYIYIPVK